MVLSWWECMEKLKNAHALARENPDIEQSFRPCKNRMKCKLTNAENVDISEATHAERARMGLSRYEFSDLGSESTMGMYPWAYAAKSSPATTEFGRRVGVSRVELQGHC